MFLVAKKIHLIEMAISSSNNICLGGKIKKIFFNNTLIWRTASIRRIFYSKTDTRIFLSLRTSCSIGLTPHPTHISNSTTKSFNSFLFKHCILVSDIRCIKDVHLLFLAVLIFSHTFWMLNLDTFQVHNMWYYVSKTYEVSALCYQ